MNSIHGLQLDSEIDQIALCALHNHTLRFVTCILALMRYTNIIYPNRNYQLGPAISPTVDSVLSGCGTCACNREDGSCEVLSVRCQPLKTQLPLTGGNHLDPATKESSYHCHFYPSYSMLLSLHMIVA